MAFSVLKADGSVKISGDVSLTGANAFTGANSFATNPLNLLVGQIGFPATQNPSSDANTLDDYEEGTWTPVIGGDGGQSGQTYDKQTGVYTKVGDIVFVGCRARFTAKGTITGSVWVSGFPFTSSNVSLLHGVPVSYFGAFNTSWSSLAGRVEQNATHGYLFGVAAGGATTITFLATGDLTNTTDLILSFMYKVA